MPKLPKFTGKEFSKIVVKLGFVYDPTKGSHMIFKHEDGRRTTIPHHAGEELGPGLLNKIIKHDLGLTREEFLRLLK
ncbi:type II toxin-antitoxin system HicA family toxin [Candidatus Woesearchaeota archaeon]|nr:type II toxin-antitoxin system HicA family toxin [Candidatus Woesearchaeota archaeon]